MGGSRLGIFFGGKSSQNGPKPGVGYHAYSVCINIVKVVVSYYDSVHVSDGFEKKFGWGVGGWHWVG